MNSMELTYRRDFIRNGLRNLEILRSMGRTHGQLFDRIRWSIRDSVRVIRRIEAI